MPKHLKSFFYHWDLRSRDKKEVMSFIDILMADTPRYPTIKEEILAAL
ncbi:MAG: hypothetical protein RIM99_15300 [Cyclobacteriaceae bacterium]